MRLVIVLSLAGVCWGNYGGVIITRHTRIQPLPYPAVSTLRLTLKVGHGPGKDVDFLLDLDDANCIPTMYDMTAYSHSANRSTDGRWQSDVIYSPTHYAHINFSMGDDPRLCEATLAHLSPVYGFCDDMLYFDGLPDTCIPTDEQPIAVYCGDGYEFCEIPLSSLQTQRVGLSHTLMSHLLPVGTSNVTLYDSQLPITTSVIYTDQVDMIIMSIPQLRYTSLYNAHTHEMLLWAPLTTVDSSAGMAMVTILIFFLCKWLDWTADISSGFRAVYQNVDTCADKIELLDRSESILRGHWNDILNYIWLVVGYKAYDTLVYTPALSPFHALTTEGDASNTNRDHVAILIAADIFLAWCASIVIIQTVARHQPTPTHPIRWRKEAVWIQYTALGVGILCALMLSVGFRTNAVIVCIAVGTATYLVLFAWATYCNYINAWNVIIYYCQQHTEIWKYRQLVALRWIVQFITLTLLTVTLPKLLGVVFREAVANGLGIRLALTTGRDAVLVGYTSPADARNISPASRKFVWILCLLVSFGAIWHTAVFMVAPGLGSTNAISPMNAVIVALVIQSIFYGGTIMVTLHQL